MKKPFLFVSMLGTLLLVLLKDWEVVAQLNQVFFGNYYDALKNYYTLLYHVKWDSSYWHFEGMNYPYGEHVLFTDNQPVLANTLKFLHNLGIPVLMITPGIMNALILFGLVLASGISYLCLTKLKVTPWMAALVAIALSFLTPQTMRMNGHFGLSYSFIIPLLLYQCLLFLEKPQTRRSLLIGLLLILFSFVHAYFLAFALLIFTVLIAISWWYKKVTLKAALQAFILQVVLPFVLVQAFMFFTDPIADRPSHPWSPFLGNYTPHGVFFPIGKPIGNWIARNFGMPYMDWEGHTYIGAFASLLFLLSAVSIPLLLFKRYKNKHPFHLQSAEGAFLLLLSVLALVVPIVFGLLTRSSDLYQLLGPARQFRSVARFVWIMFFSVNFYFFYWLSSRLKKPTPRLYYSLAIVGVLLLVQDAYQQAKEPFVHAYKLAWLQEGSTEQQELETLLEGYDVLIPLPYFHIGSESFSYERGEGEHFKNAMGISHASGIPMTAVMLSRTSLSQTLASLPYFIPTSNEGKFLEPLKGKQALLLVTAGKELNPREQQLLKAAPRLVYAKEDVQLYAFEPALLEKEANTLERAMPERPYGSPTDNPTAMSIPAALPRTIETLSLDTLGEQFTFSLWVYLNQDTKPLESVELHFYDAQGVHLGQEQVGIRNSLSLLHGYWGLIEHLVNKPAGATRMEVSLGRNGLYATPTYIQKPYLSK
jgi:hypothetical protein